MKARTEADVRRLVELRVWMQMNQVTTAWAAKEMGVPQSTLYGWLFQRETIRPNNREALIGLGFPAEFLPPGELIKAGPMPKIPIFVQQQA